MLAPYLPSLPLPPTLRRAQQLLALDLNNATACQHAHILHADANACSGQFDHFECCAHLHNETSPVDLDCEIGEILAQAV